jgi:hypothetical protein
MVNTYSTVAAIRDSDVGAGRGNLPGEEWWAIPYFFVRGVKLECVARFAACQNGTGFIFIASSPVRAEGLRCAFLTNSQARLEAWSDLLAEIVHMPFAHCR